MLLATDLDEEVATGAEQSSGGRHDAPDHLGTIDATVEGESGLVALDVRRQERDRLGRNVRGDGRDQVEPRGVADRGDEVADDGEHPVPPSAPHRAWVDVNADHGRRRNLGREMRRDRACTGTDVERRATLREERCRSACQLLGLGSGHIDARIDRVPPVAEPEPTRDPLQRLARLAAGKPSVERGIVGRDLEQLGGLVLGRNTTGAPEPGNGSLVRAQGETYPRTTVRPRMPRVARSAPSEMTGKMPASRHTWSISDQS